MNYLNEMWVKSMNLYIVENNINIMGGVERIVSTLANSFIKKNYNVNVISLYKTREEPFYEYDSMVIREYFTSNLRKKCIIHIPNSVIIRHKIKKICKKINENDIVIFGRVEVACDFLPYLKTKNIIVRDAIQYYHYKKSTIRIMKRYFNEKVRLFIVSSSESLNTYLEKLGLKNMKKIYNPLGIKPINNFKIDNKKILAVGRYDLQKGFENLIRACNFVLKKNKDWSLEIVGIGNNTEKLKEYVDNEIKDRVIFNSGVKNVVSKLNEAGIFVMTSRYEGYANALVEALACGVPAISYNWLLGVDDIINNGKNGIIVNLKDRFEYAKGIDMEEDILNLSDAILMMINDNEKRLKMSKEAEKIFESRDVEKIISIWQKEIEEVIKNECADN